MPREKSDELLFILGIDHRFDVFSEVLGDDGSQPSAADLERAANLKQLVFAALRSAVESGLPKSQAGIWSETKIGEAVLLRARGMSLITVASVERPRVSEFQFEDALGFANRLKQLDATYAGARVHYNPTLDAPAKESNRHQLKRLSDICRSGNPDLLIELIPVPTEEELQVAGDREAWDRQFRPEVLIDGIRELQDSGVEPDVWVIEPPLDATAAATVSAQAHVDDRTETGVLFMVGDNPDDAIDSERVRETITLAARTPGVQGLVIGPAAYASALRRYNAGKLDHRDAVDQIEANIWRIVSSFTEARRTSDVS